VARFTQQLAHAPSSRPAPRTRAVDPRGAGSNQRRQVDRADLLGASAAATSLSEALAKHHPRPFSAASLLQHDSRQANGAVSLELHRCGGSPSSPRRRAAAFAEAVLTSGSAYPAGRLSRSAFGAIVFLMDVRHPAVATIFRRPRPDRPAADPDSAGGVRGLPGVLASPWDRRDSFPRPSFLAWRDCGPAARRGVSHWDQNAARYPADRTAHDEDRDGALRADPRHTCSRAGCRS
jgi:hypothetical protein